MRGGNGDLTGWELLGERGKTYKEKQFKKTGRFRKEL